MVEVGTGSSGTRFLRSDWPIEEGLTLGTNKLRSEPHLQPQEADLSNKDDQVGL